MAFQKLGRSLHMPRLLLAAVLIILSTAVTAMARGSLISDTEGRIQHLLVHYADFDIIPTLHDLLTNLSPTTQITIVCSSKEERSILQRLLHEWKVNTAKKESRVDIITMNQPIEYWVRDQFIVLKNGTILLPRQNSSASGPSSLNRIYSKQQQRRLIHKTPFQFDGGNVVSSDSHLFIGYNMVLNNIGQKFRTAKAFLDAFQKQVGKKVVVVGGPTIDLPHGHIDMFLTPIDSKRLLLGDPSLAIQALEKSDWLRRSYAPVYFDRTRTPLSNGVLDSIYSSSRFIQRMKNELATDRGADIALATLFSKNRLPKLNRQFRQIAAQLGAKGFEVIRIPILLNHAMNNSPFMTYNNMLLETGPGFRNAYLPQYNVEPLDTLARTIMIKKLRYSVKAIDVQNIAYYDGTLRCITQVLKRS